MEAPFWLTEDKQSFPHPSLALKEPDGLLAIGGDLTVPRLLAAYSQGIFPWYNEDQPILWWSPDPRTILFFDDYHVSKSLQKRINKGGYTVQFDQQFSQVVEACQQPRPNQQGTWITKEMKQAYLEMHRFGYAHSVEVMQDNELVGGLYGISLGHAFFGESMFSKKDDGSKLALFHLIEKLKTWQFEWIDCQVWSEHLGTLGASTIPREKYLSLLQRALYFPHKTQNWQSD